jgi:hypothetical protein
MSRRMRWVGHVARIKEKMNACGIMMGKPEGKRPPRRRRHGWVNNIEMDLEERDDLVVSTRFLWLRVEELS